MNVWGKLQKHEHRTAVQIFGVNYRNTNIGLVLEYLGEATETGTYDCYLNVWDKLKK